MSTEITKPSRMIDLFAQGAEFLKVATGHIYKLEGSTIYVWSSYKWETEISDNISYCLFKPATIAENPEKPKRVVYNWVYKRSNSSGYYLTLQKFTTEETAKLALMQTTELGEIEFLEKIEHSREEV